MTDILLVNPHIFPYDLRGEGEWSSHRALNYGLLSTATYLEKQGIPSRIVDLQGLREPLGKLEECLKQENPRFVGIGCVSALSYLPTLEIARHVKSLDPEIIVGVGGQHTRFILKETFEESEGAIDIIATGEGEETMRQIRSWLDGKRELSDVGGIALRKDNDIMATSQNHPIDLKYVFPIDYLLYPDYLDFFPLIEDSRGCFSQCTFCSNERVFGSTMRFKDPDMIVDETRMVAELYQTASLPMIFYNSIFGMRPMDVKNVMKRLQSLHVRIQFLSSTRVDSGWRQYVDDLEGLCDQMHFGLESGSPEILLRMGKTKNPEKYLRSAREAFRAFHEKGIHVGLNILTGFCGENSTTLNETEQFLEENKAYIDSIRSHPLVLYPGSSFGGQLPEFTKRFGSRLTSNTFSARIHVYPVDATSNLSYDDATAEGRRLMQRFNSPSHFFDYYKWLVGPVRMEGGIGFLPEKEFTEMVGSRIDPSRFDFGPLTGVEP